MTIKNFSIKNNISFSKTEVRIAFRNCGYIDDDINQYIERDGYKGLFKTLKMTPEAVIEEIKKSGIKTSGNGIPVWMTWEICRKASGEDKYLICDSYDSFSGSSINNVLLGGDTHAVIEGMLTGARVAGASQGYIFINTGSGLKDKLFNAVKQMEEYLSVNNNPPVDPRFKLNIIEINHCVVLDEKSARISNTLNDNAFPVNSFPTTAGIKNRPTIVHTAETWANISAIMQKGAGYFAGYGTSKSKGTKIVSLVGAIKNKCIIEVPFGTSLRHIIYDIGGGIGDGTEIKAVQIGGHLGGLLTQGDLDIPLDYDDLISKGCIIGTGDITVLNTNTCIVDFTKNLISITKAASCGECVICREGTAQMLQIIKDISEGRGKPGDSELLLELSDGLKTASLCSYGKNAANIVMTGLKYFEDEYKTHIKEKKCPVNVCKMNN